MIRSLKYLSLLLWLVGAGVLYVIYATQGLPHMIWSYEFLDNGDQYNPFAERHYTSCSFVGPYGVFTVSAQNGHCGWVRLFREAR